MATPAKTSLNLEDMLSSTELEELFALAEEQKRSVRDVVQIAIENYIVRWQVATREPDPDFEEDSDEYILAGFKQAWHEAMTGQHRPFDEVLKELRAELENEKDES